MAKEHIYTVKSGSYPDVFIVHKLDRDYELIENISVSRRQANNRELWLCSCYAQTRPTCRHRSMVQKFLAEGLVDSGKLYDYDKGTFVPQKEYEDGNENE